MLHGDFGISYTYKTPVTELVVQRLGVSLPLAVISLTLTVLIAFPAGIIAAARRNSGTDFAVMSTTQVGRRGAELLVRDPPGLGLCR